MARSSSYLYYILYVSIGFLYPAYCSLLALQTKEKKDDQIWLIYWIVFGTFNVLEVFADLIFFWFPLYPIFKLGFLAWCTAPIGRNGAYYVYKVLPKVVLVCDMRGAKYKVCH
ncbi:hypothetical protein JTE90_023851 [Oedothorax gibbosus]|uniref:Receptor expression-enhancing protein n=1 Tax=Oedothorax gibbosus TaxID=931172 RepID=A0AAV6VK72_9ARAC|nr:hypothetical protein JTE90_023851 [Oedothorax gibbosus]